MGGMLSLPTKILKLEFFKVFFLMFKWNINQWYLSNFFKVYIRSCKLT
jgi:hypothetical protein